MRQSTVVIAAVLMAAISVSVFARGSSGGGGQGGHAVSGRAGPGSHGGHGYSGARSHPGHGAPHRYFGGGARVGVIIGVPLLAPLFYPGPGAYYAPAPAYIAPAPAPANYWYFCPELNAYYPYVTQCPGRWQPVLPQPPG